MEITFKNAGQRNTAPFRADMVGSFLRPRALKEARRKFERREISAGELRKVEDAEIVKLVEKQQAIGLQAVTDGEFRRSWWHLDFMWGLEGVEKRSIAKGYQFQGEETRAETAGLTGKIRFGDHSMLKDYQFLRTAAGDAVIARQTIPAPAQFLAELQRGGNQAITSAVYDNAEELIADIAAAYRDAIQAFYTAGCRNLQLDDCTWGMLCDKAYWEERQQQGVDAAAIARLYARVNREAIQGRPSDMAITLHVCRGNYHSTWAASGGYEPVAEVLFDIAGVDGFYLEFDTERAGDFAPLRFIKDQQVVLGLVSSKNGELERKEDIIARLAEAAEFVPIDQLCLSPQCGFASTEEGNILTEEQQWAKLRLIKEVAGEVWPAKPV
ncbi:5-methyltetrahydropteroyltriglutamate--homocysteine S-methyltransferase|uniref:Methionine synthase II (Cobalamin-independent) n=1 Tax=Dendrosporobacter quercicolus TaxID=146817 RepID=A0A1G9YHN2_9FIRM|nr:5-methyltetrahydropteroyltriglutamate--homocysteine S-methyltransferase [Dendrosporobacter quercicolus]NSL47644.1 5-methyltetrahydropteroyltriglutamate--homocysteine S-methyltransferase [Dendrosporobacter quercicolus DSM 1736]SDN08011.1 Methionine synthase II (cobalamin-independent) [Dendrosporobacter quercicolus]